MGTFKFSHRLHEHFKISLKNLHAISFVLLTHILRLHIISHKDYCKKRENVVYSNQYATLLRGSPRFSYRTVSLGKRTWSHRLACSLSPKVFPPSTRKYTTITQMALIEALAYQSLVRFLLPSHIGPLWGVGINGGSWKMAKSFIERQWFLATNLHESSIAELKE